jgi:hypothetical protein
MVRTRMSEDQAQPDLNGGDGEDDGNGYLAGAGEPARLARVGEVLSAGNLRRSPSGIASPRRVVSGSAIHEHSCEPLPAALISSFGRFG